jgi:hypothetical protein
MGGNEFATRTIDSHKALIEQQQQLEQLFPDERWMGLSVAATIRKVLDKRDVQLATKLKKEFKLDERLFLRLRLVALARLGAFDEFEQLVKGKRPLVSVEQLVSICVAHGRADEAEKYLARCQGKQRFAALLHLKRFVEAAEVADSVNDVELIEKAYKAAQAADPTQANQISQRYAN